jgi:hypothetical protein
MSKPKKSTLASLALYFLVGRIPFSKKLLTSAIARSRRASGAYLIFRIVRRFVRTPERTEITVITKEAHVETH